MKAKGKGQKAKPPAPNVHLTAKQARECWAILYRAQFNIERALEKETTAGLSTGTIAGDYRRQIRQLQRLRKALSPPNVDQAGGKHGGR